MNKIIIIGFALLITISELTRKENPKHEIKFKIERYYKLTKADAG